MPSMTLCVVLMAVYTRITVRLTGTELKFNAKENALVNKVNKSLFDIRLSIFDMRLSFSYCDCQNFSIATMSSNFLTFHRNIQRL